MIRSFLVSFLLVVGLGCRLGGAYLDAPIDFASSAPVELPALAYDDLYYAVVLDGVDPALAVAVPVDELVPVAPVGVRRTTSGPGIGQWRRA